MSVRRGATLSDWKFDWKTWPWRHLFGEGRKPAKSARVHRRPYPGVIDGCEHYTCRPSETRTRFATLDDTLRGREVIDELPWSDEVKASLMRGERWRRLWQRWSRKRRAARKRRRGWA